MFSNNKVFSSLQGVFMIFINICCVSAFLVQIFLITYDFLLPNETVTSTYKQDLDKITFPSIFKICIVPGFNDSMLSSQGYSSVSSYFDGQNIHNESNFGWGGHSKEKNKSHEGKIYNVIIYP